jgi:predicted nucleic acid-binding protein
VSVFVDTSALLALLDADDHEHERAKTTSLRSLCVVEGRCG